MKFIYGLSLLLISFFIFSFCSAATYDLHLAWDAPTAGGEADGYQLWYKETGGSYSFANVVDVPSGLTGQVTIDKYTNYTFKCLAYSDGVFSSDKSYVLKFNENGGSADTINIYDISDYGEHDGVVDEGTHDGLDNASVLTDTTKTWVEDALIGEIVINTTDDSSCTITDNDATTITCTLTGGTENDWDIGDSYDIPDNDAAILTDSTENWTEDELIGDIVWNLTDGSSCTITDNDATTVTCTLSGGDGNDWDYEDEYDILASPDELYVSTSLLPDTVTVTGSTSNNDTFTTYDSLETGEFEDGIFVLDATEALTTEEDAEGVHVAFSFVNYDFSADPTLTDFLNNDPDRDEISIGTATMAYADQITSIYVIISGSVSNDGTYIADTITKDLITLNAAEDLTDEGFIELTDDGGEEVSMTLRLVSDPSNEVIFEYLLNWDVKNVYQIKNHANSLTAKHNTNGRRLIRK